MVKIEFVHGGLTKKSKTLAGKWQQNQFQILLEED